MSDVISKERLFRFENTLFQWTESCKEATNEIKALADNLDEHFGRIMKAKIGGSTAGILEVFWLQLDLVYLLSPLEPHWDYLLQV